MRVGNRFAAALLALCSTFVAHSAEPKDGSDCAGFAAKDAAEYLKVPAAQVSRRASKVDATLWLCSYDLNSKPALSFSIGIAPNAKQATAELEAYRGHLSTAGATAPYKDNPKGAYSDIMGGGVGDEAVWTDINSTLAVRKGKFTLLFTLPAGKIEQLKFARVVLARF